jgi:hypothetical protein
MASRRSLRFNDQVASSPKQPATRGNPENSSIALRTSTRANKGLQPFEDEPPSPKHLRNNSSSNVQSPRAKSVSLRSRTDVALAKSSPNSNKVTPNLKKRNFDALVGDSALKGPNGTRMKDGPARIEPVNITEQNAVQHATRSRPATASPPKPLVQTTTTTGPVVDKPSDASKSEEARALRSKAGGSRLKSDLATYFPNYEDIIAGVSRESGTQHIHIII